MRETESVDLLIGNDSLQINRVPVGIHEALKGERTSIADLMALEFFPYVFSFQVTVNCQSAHLATGDGVCHKCSYPCAVSSGEDPLDVRGRALGRNLYHASPAQPEP